MPGGLVVTLEGDEYPARAIGERTFEITEGDAIRDRSTSRSRASVASAAGSPSGSRDPAGSRCRSSCDGGRRRGGPRRRWNAADAAVAASLVSCVAETLMTGLLGGGHAIYFDAGERHRPQPRLLRLGAVRIAAQRWNRCPSGSATRSWTTRSAPSSCAVPGLPAGLDALWRAHGRLPWAELVEPALQVGPRRRRDAEGARVVPRDARAGDDDARRRRDLRARRPSAQRGRPAPAAGSRPGARARSRRGRDLGLHRLDRGSPARADGERVTGRSPPTISPRTPRPGRSPVDRDFAGRRVRTRAGLSGLPETLARFDPAGGADALLEALERGSDDRRTHHEHHGHRRRGQRVCADVEPRARARAIGYRGSTCT